MLEHMYVWECITGTHSLTVETEGLVFWTWYRYFIKDNVDENKLDIIR